MDRTPESVFLARQQQEWKPLLVLGLVFHVVFGLLVAAVMFWEPMNPVVTKVAMVELVPPVPKPPEPEPPKPLPPEPKPLPDPKPGLKPITKPTPVTPAKPTDPVPPNAATDPTPPDTLPLPDPEMAMPKFSGKPMAGVVGTTRDPRLGMYNGQIVAAIEPRWRPPEVDDARSGASVVVEFVIFPNGSKSEARIRISSGSSVLDRMAERAVNLAQMPPFPPGLNRSEYKVSYRLVYE